MVPVVVLSAKGSHEGSWSFIASTEPIFEFTQLNFSNTDIFGPIIDPRIVRSMNSPIVFFWVISEHGAIVFRMSTHIGTIFVSPYR